MATSHHISHKIALLADKYLASERLTYYALGTFLSFLAPLFVLVLWMFIFMAVDMYTGIRASVVNGFKFRSRKLRRSINKGVYYMVFIILAHALDVSILWFMNLNLAQFACAIICGIELYSILENMYKLTGARTFKVLINFTIKKIKSSVGCDISGTCDKNKERKK